MWFPALPTHRNQTNEHSRQVRAKADLGKSIEQLQMQNRQVGQVKH